MSSSEQQLLLLCARSVSSTVADNIRALALRDDIAWQRLLDSAAYHRVLPLVYRTLAQVCPDLVPQQVMQVINRRCAAIAARNLYLMSELRKLLGSFVGEGVRAIAYKGPVLAASLYGSVGGREFWDLDVLVHPSDYETAKCVLGKDGYRVEDDWGHECTWLRDSDMVYVDLHRALTHPAMRFPLEFDRVHSRLEQHVGPLSGIGLLNSVDTLIVLCVQLAKDTAGNRPLRLSKLCDLAELLRTRSDMDWSAVHEESRRLGCERIVAFGLLCAREALGAPVPGHLISRAGLDHAGLMAHLRARLFSAAANERTRFSFARFHFMIRERWVDKLYPYYYKIVTPNQEDRALVLLPKWLQFLYYPIRLARVVSTAAKGLASRFMVT